MIKKILLLIVLISLFLVSVSYWVRANECIPYNTPGLGWGQQTHEDDVFIWREYRIGDHTISCVTRK